MTRKYCIGGFFEMAQPEDVTDETNLARRLLFPENPKHTFNNARSALAVLLRGLKPKKFWLPSYICPSLAQNMGVDVQFYPVTPELQPDVSFLRAHVKAGDVLLGVNYFGRLPQDAFLAYTKQQPEVVFIEDCAHTIPMQQGFWGDYMLFSPRKLVGLADGGYFVADQVQTIQFELSHPDSHELNRWQASLLRYSDALNSDLWHPINQTKEKNMSVGRMRMSRLGHELIHQINVEKMIEKRQENFAQLHASLGHLSFLELSDDYCPFGFVVRLNPQTREHVRHILIEHQIFPAIHWENLPSSEDEFPEAHQLSKELLTLPCDQRYDVADMDYITDVVYQALS